MSTPPHTNAFLASLLHPLAGFPPRTNKLRHERRRSDGPSGCFHQRIGAAPTTVTAQRRGEHSSAPPRALRRWQKVAAPAPGFAVRSRGSLQSVKSRPVPAAPCGRGERGGPTPRPAARTPLHSRRTRVQQRRLSAMTSKHPALARNAELPCCPHIPTACPHLGRAPGTQGNAGHLPPFALPPARAKCRPGGIRGNELQAS